MSESQQSVSAEEDYSDYEESGKKKAPTKKKISVSKKITKIVTPVKQAKSDKKKATSKKITQTKEKQNDEEDKPKAKPRAKKTKSKQEDLEDEEEKEEVEFLPGQKKETPDENDSHRAYYESLYQMNPQSEMAQKYMWVIIKQKNSFQSYKPHMLEFGLLDPALADKLFKKQKYKK